MLLCLLAEVGKTQAAMGKNERKTVESEGAGSERTN